ncbi:MAG: flavin reductase family protein [Clostridia bacterium]|nr:flavin reductase family protein [Clostridia bacterium]
MAKLQWKPGTLLAPAPPALVSCGTMEAHNVLTAAWTGIVCSEPPMTYVSIRPERYSHHMILERGEFVINLPTQAIVRATDLCGVKSGRDGDKFALAGLTAEPSALVAAPGIGECPVSLECRVREVLHLGSHDMFLSDIVAVDVDPGYVDEKGALHLEKAGLLAYAHGGYYGLGRQLGTFGFSVRKKPVRRGAKPAKRK